MRFFIIIIILLLLMYAGITVYSFIEAHILKISHAVLKRSATKKNDTDEINKLPDCLFEVDDPKSLKDIRNTKILFISDLHAEFCFIPAGKVIKVIREAEVDAVIFGGDICNNAKRYMKGINYLLKIKDACDELKIPFIGTTGNHDIFLNDAQIKQAGFTDLREGPVAVRDVLISGVNDTGKKKRVWDDNPVTDTKGLTHLLVSHNPDWLLEAAKKSELDNVDHMLSGHIHGGQFRFPFRIEINVIRKDRLPRRKVIEGVFDGAGITFFISRGIGCVLIPFRLGSYPEITVVEIEAKN